MSFSELAASESPISVIKYSIPANDTLLVASYDNNVSLYNYSKKSLAVKLASPAPVLSIAYSSHRTTYAGHLDGTIREIDFENMNFSRPCVSIQAPDSAKTDSVPNVSSGINCFRSLDGTSLVASTFSGVLVQFDPRSSRASHKTQTQGKIFAMDTCNRKITVAKSQSAVEVWDARNMAVPVHKRSTGLRFQATNLRCFPSGDGYALSSVDGRVSMEYYEDSASAQEQKFAFKCHRVKDKVAGEDVVYPVTGLEFHPQYKSLFTAGGDGNVCVWNWAKRKRMKLLCHHLESPRSISHMDISGDGQSLAIAVSDDSYTRASSVGKIAAGGGKILIRNLTDADCKPKS
ncbi:hypothetical protein OY671_003082 [Metschnikowia pulcherrima]|nr:hypothetical protein OY671_003082 [Metschnikowia pulcherrima]